MRGNDCMGNFGKLQRISKERDHGTAKEGLFEERDGKHNHSNARPGFMY